MRLRDKFRKVWLLAIPLAYLYYVVLGVNGLLAFVLILSACTLIKIYGIGKLVCKVRGSHDDKGARALDLGNGKWYYAKTCLDCGKVLENDVDPEDLNIT